MTYYRRQRMESFKRAMFADHLDRTLVGEEDPKAEEVRKESWWMMLPFERAALEPGKLVS